MGPGENGMGDLDLNGSRGYFRDLANPAFDDFWCAYQADKPLDSRNFSLVYRRLIAASMLLNHFSDKIAAELWPKIKKGEDRLKKLEPLIEAISPVALLKLDACRHFSNDLKHVANKLHSFDSRPRNPDYDDPGEHDVFCFFMKYPKKPDPIDLCIAAGDAFNFWRGYYSHEFRL